MVEQYCKLVHDNFKRDIKLSESNQILLFGTFLDQLHCQDGFKWKFLLITRKLCVNNGVKSLPIDLKQLGQVLLLIFHDLKKLLCPYQ